MSIVSCLICSMPVMGSRKIYCSSKCSNRGKYEREVASGYEEVKRRRRAKTWAEHVVITARPACSVDGCDRPHTAKGLCPMHYKRTKPRKPGDGHRGRARRHGVAFEPVNRLSVFERDAWTCGICGSAVDRSLTFPAPGSASLDHVVPISRGGTHTRDNVQCSHLSCNVRKGDKVPDDLEGPTGWGMQISDRTHAA